MHKLRAATVERRPKRVEFLMRYVFLYRTWRLMLSLIWLSSIASQAAAAEIPLRAVILFDNSGSMRHHDPQRLSHMAAQLFLDLARPHDQVGLAAFSDDSILLVPLTTVSSPEARQPFVKQLRSLRFDGQTTDLGTALRVGLASFPERPSGQSRDLVLLLTDGKLDLGPQRRAAEPLALEYILETLLPQYRKQGVALYTIAFTKAADHALLQEMAQTVGGEFRFIPNAQMLHKAFSDLFVVAKEAESIPMQNGAVLMDPSIQEASLVLSKPHPQEPVGLVTPQQKRLDATSTHPGVTWNTTSSYDMVRLAQPAPGKWQVKRSSDGGDDVAIIGASILNLQVSLSPGYLEAGEPLTMQVQFVEQGQPLHDRQRLQGLAVHAEIMSPTGQSRTIQLQPHDAGEFAATLRTPENPGQYGLVIVASGPTLKRQRTLSFLLQPRCFEPSVLAEPPVTVRVTLNSACPFFRQLQLETRYDSHAEEGEGAHPWLPLTPSQPRVFQTTLPPPVPGSEKTVVLRIRGFLGPQDFTLIRGPLPLPALPAPVLHWSALVQTVGLQLLVVNAVLGLCGGCGYGLYRYCTNRRRGSNA